VGSSLLFFDKNLYNPSYSSLLNFTASTTGSSFMQTKDAEVANNERIPWHWSRVVLLLSPYNNGKVESTKNTTIATAKQKVIPMTPRYKEEKDEKEYRDGLPDPLETEKCQVQYQWQKDSKPTCNGVHELDMNAFYHSPRNKRNRQTNMNDSEERLRLIANGGWRDVWAFYPDHPFKRPYILKTLRYDIDVVPRNIDRHRRDAMVMERLSSSANIVDIYAFCGNSGFTAFANGGDIEGAIDKMREQWPLPEVKLERLHIGM
jgi:hypothetical protein